MANDEFTFDTVQKHLDEINSELDTYASNAQSVDTDVLGALNNGEEAAITSPALGTYLKEMWTNNTIALYEFKANYDNWCIALTEVMIENGINDQEVIDTYTNRSLEFKSSYRTTNEEGTTTSTNYEAVRDARTILTIYDGELSTNPEVAKANFMEAYEGLSEEAQQVIREEALKQVQAAAEKARSHGMKYIPTGGNPIYTTIAQQYNNKIAQLEAKPTETMQEIAHN